MAETPPHAGERAWAGWCGRQSGVVKRKREKAVVDIEISERPANSKLDNYIFVYIRAQGRITKSAHNDP